MSLSVFGYGSLVWRPDLPYRARHPATLVGWARRFWQGSPDHRGTEGRPGRVVTLVRDPEAVTVGVVYQIAPEAADAVLATLDHRERAGFERVDVVVDRLDGGGLLDAMTYRATEHNPWFLGAASVADMARDVLASAGESGDNREYVLRLHEGLVALGANDEHVATLAEALGAP